MPPSKRALFLDWGGTLALTKNNRTVVDGAGHPVLMPHVVATLARERPRFDACFIVSNQARVSSSRKCQCAAGTSLSCPASPRRE